jgi:hypothetical protein
VSSGQRAAEIWPYAKGVPFEVLKRRAGLVVQIRNGVDTVIVPERSMVLARIFVLRGEQIRP